MKKCFLAFAVAFLTLPASHLMAFCGFYVAKADTKLYNKASQVAIVRSGDRTVMTMANDFEGDPKEFAIVIPVPTVLQKGQIHIADKALLDHLDNYSSPRLVEYTDDNPCQRRYLEEAMAAPMAMQKSDAAARRRADSLGVKIEARYTVGEYDILILSAKQSSGLETWLVESGYRIPAGASSVLDSYVKQGMKFFVAKVNLQEQSKLGFKYLRPISVAYTSAKFMLPIRLGTVNSKGTQELFIYAITPKGRVETTNYRTVKLPSNVDVPVFVKDQFGQFYKAMFNRQVIRENMKVVFLEYAWNMASCDPCSAEPLSQAELRELGAFWLGDNQNLYGGQQAFLTRLHVRYDGPHFPEDLFFQETGDSESFQARYVMHHPWTGDDSCREADNYRAALPGRRETEALNLANITGWNVNDIRRNMGINRTATVTPPAAKATPPPADEKSWWDKIWHR
ncbi:MAG: DUF2330 domain-containing protein [Acidobacteriota bacterium]